MKRVFFSAIALVLILGSSFSSSKNKAAKSDNNTECTILEIEKEKTICKKEPKGEVVEVLYFHGQQRNDTCRVVENLTLEVINKKFAKELKNGKLQVSVIDFSTHEGELIAHRYNIAWSSLLINKWIDGKECVDNITESSFTIAEKHPDKFKMQIEAKVAMLLKG